LAVALTAACLAAPLSGCAEQDVLERPPIFSIRTHVYLGHGTTDTQPNVEISSLYKTDQPIKVSMPSSAVQDIWLRPGDYVVKIERCNQLSIDDNLTKYGTRLGPDHLFKISIQAKQDYYMTCTVDLDGVIYSSNAEVKIGAID
jgi:hypothetical protein